MRKLLFCLFSLAASTSLRSQIAFTPGNLLITKVGAGTSTLSSKSAPVYLVEITPTGTEVQTIAVPFLDNMLTPGNNKLVTQGSSSNDANLSLSGDGKYFVLAGYNCDTTISAPSSASPRVQRTIARISMSGVVNTSTLIDTIRSTSNSRMATTNDGTGFWHIGASGGVRYVPFGSTGASPNDTTVVVSTTVSNLRSVQTYGGDLYIGSASGTITRIGKITGLPTTNTNAAITALQGTSMTVFANSIFMTSLPGGPSGLNTMYVADDGGSKTGIRKYSLNATTGNWDSLGMIDVGGAYRGLTANVSGSTVTLYAVKASTPLLRFTDVSGYGVAPTTFTAPYDTVYKAATNTAVRGVGLIPATILPIRLLSFNASKTDNGKAKAWWVVAADDDVLNYVVEKSTNSTSYTAVATIKPSGRTTYEFLDNDNLNTTTFYRVKFVKQNGEISYSQVVAVTPQKIIKLQVFPNPAQNNLFVSFPKTIGVAGITLITKDGKTIVNKGIAAGSTQATLDISTLSRGMYTVKFVDADGNSSTSTIFKN